MKVYIVLYDMMYKRNIYCYYTSSCITRYTRRCIMTIFIFHYIREYIMKNKYFLIHEIVFLIIQDVV